MEILTKQINRNQQNFLLTNQRVVFWEEEQALLISDLHLGKSTHFRQNGIPISTEVAKCDLFRLGETITHFNPQKVIIIGDFFHARENDELNLFKAFQANFNISWQLIKGNHDILNASVYRYLNFDISHNSYSCKSICLIHEPQVIENHFAISGHIHPGVLLKTNQKQKLKLPCYLVSEQQLILPAFSKFTGLDTNFRKRTSFQALAFDETILTWVL